MGRATKFILIALLTLTLYVGAQTASAAPSRELGQASPASGTVNSTPQSAPIRILTPVANQKLSSNAATVRFQLANPAALRSTPSFLVQMDARDPIATSQTQQEFTGLSAGAHTVTVELADANGLPTQGGRAAVHFFVGTETPAATASTTAARRELKIAGFTFQRPDPATVDRDESDLPPASSPLPLISIIGFGVLVGGIVSAMKTRS